ncbi:site-specific integrase [Paenibacillus sp. JMULE4]|uniref:tyrosine-type recombinase/integrase n=1 Tax=Paenibacillus TaxID=44249 RepID=UPI00157556D5|nr:site-specific integrase [Paenibacillus sp. JMULE4]NTZ17304.1 site-specific integrase [Paenibacillus sp. JMULE4]
MDNDQNIKDIDILGFTYSDHWKQNAKTIAEIASYAKSTSLECLETSPTGNHDIRSLSWEKVLSFLNNLYAFRWPEEDTSISSLGSHGLNEWLFKTQIQGRIFTPVVLDFLEKKKSLKSTSYFSLIQYALELINFFKTRTGLDARSIQDKELTNKDDLINFTEQSYPDFIQRDMILAISRKLFSYEFDLKKPCESQSPEEATQVIHHPAINAHIIYLIRSGVKVKSVAKYKFSYTMFMNWLHTNYIQFQSNSINDLPLSMVTEELLIEFRQYLLRLASKGVYSKHTVSDRFYDIRYLLSNLFKLGWLSKDITLDVSGIPYEKYLYRDLPTDAELQNFYQTILRHSDQPILELAAFGLMLLLGLRIHEVASIRYEDLNIENKTISVFGKNEKSVLLPLPEPLQKYFQSLMASRSRNDYVFGDNIQAIIRELRARYRLYSFVAGWNYPGGPHLLRHAFISRLSERSDCPPQLLMYLARHDRPENTARYVHRSPHQLTDAVNKINY